MYMIHSHTEVHSNRCSTFLIHWRTGFKTINGVSDGGHRYSETLHSFSRDEVCLFCSLRNLYINYGILSYAQL